MSCCSTLPSRAAAAMAGAPCSPADASALGPLPAPPPPAGICKFARRPSAALGCGGATVTCVLPPTHPPTTDLALCLRSLCLRKLPVDPLPPCTLPNALQHWHCSSRCPSRLARPSCSLERSFMMHPSRSPLPACLPSPAPGPHPTLPPRSTQHTIRPCNLSSWPCCRCLHGVTLNQR